MGDLIREGVNSPSRFVLYQLGKHLAKGRSTRWIELSNPFSRIYALQQRLWQRNHRVDVEGASLAVDQGGQRAVVALDGEPHGAQPKAVVGPVACERFNLMLDVMAFDVDGLDVGSAEFILALSLRVDARLRLPLDLEFLRDMPNIKSVLFVSSLGTYGTDSLAGIMAGDINSPGRTADTFSGNPLGSPAAQNYGD